jgi:hypothetical protein
MKERVSRLMGLRARPGDRPIFNPDIKPWELIVFVVIVVAAIRLTYWLF